MLYSDSSDDFIARVKNIEDRADKCLEHLALLKVPKYIARWTILTTTIHMIEDNYNRFGPESSGFRAAMLNLCRHAPFLISSLGEKQMPAVP
jgi:hypothetical protein